MALQNSGAISLDDIHVEAGGTTGTSASINDSDIRGLIDKSDGATMAFNEWYGAQNIGYVEGTGGTTSESGNFRFHTFTSSGTFDITATAFNSHNNKSRIIKYINCVPTSVGAITLDATVGDAEVISFPVTFKIDFFEII